MKVQGIGEISGTDFFPIPISIYGSYLVLYVHGMPPAPIHYPKRVNVPNPASKTDSTT